MFDDETILICGHADNGHDVVIEKDDVYAFGHYLERLLEVVGGAISAGKTKEEIMAIESIEGAPEWQGKGIGRSLSAAYLELAGT